MLQEWKSDYRPHFRVGGPSEEVTMMYLMAQRPLGDAPSLFGVQEGCSRGIEVVVQRSKDSLCRGRRMAHQILSLYIFSLGMEALFSALIMIVPSPPFFSTSLFCFLLFSLGLLSMGVRAFYSILHSSLMVPRMHQGPSVFQGHRNLRFLL